MFSRTVMIFLNFSSGFRLRLASKILVCSILIPAVSGHFRLVNMHLLTCKYFDLK